MDNMIVNPTPASWARFAKKFSVRENGCWSWSAARDSWGYGCFAPDGRRVARAHRVAYTWLVGPIPNGLQIDHLCGNRSCVNPDHLEPVTDAENKKRRHIDPPEKEDKSMPVGSVNLNRDTKERLDELHRVTGITRTKILALLMQQATPKSIVEAQAQLARVRAEREAGSAC